MKGLRGPLWWWHSLVNFEVLILHSPPFHNTPYSFPDGSSLESFRTKGLAQRNRSVKQKREKKYGLVKAIIQQSISNQDPGTTLTLPLRCVALDHYHLTSQLALFLPSDTTTWRNISSDTYQKWESHEEELPGLNSWFAHRFCLPLKHGARSGFYLKWPGFIVWVMELMHISSLIKCNSSQLEGSISEMDFHVYELKGYCWSHVVNFLSPRIPF